MMDVNNYLDIVAKFRNSNVLVIGDFMTDIYIRGISTRICPEAPVPVVDVSSRTVSLGGAANTASNVRMLGASVTLCTVIGKDPVGVEAIELLSDFKDHRETVLTVPDRTTICKTRVVAGHQLITRFDSGTTAPIDDATTECLISYLRRAFPNFDAVILSDYEKGVFSVPLVKELARLRKLHRNVLVVDSKRLPFFKVVRPTVVKPNYDEVIRLLQLSPCHEARCEQMLGAAETLFERTGSELVAITMDCDGSMIFRKGEPVYLVKGHRVISPQVAGAGDAYIAGFALAYAHTNDPAVSAEIATAVATVAIGKTSTARCSAAELQCHFYRSRKHVYNPNDLKMICERYRTEGKKVVFTNGCFDILHSGHVAYLETAKAQGDVLIVGLNTDESIRRLKGISRPVNNLSDRITVLTGLASVDHVITFGNEGDDTPVELIGLVRPHVFVKGGDYIPRNLPEYDTLISMNTQIVIVPTVPDRSTTNIIKRVHQAEFLNVSDQ